MYDIVIVGAGPSGCLAAKVLSSLGYSVAIITKNRNFNSIEGISDRVISTLKYYKFENTVKSLPSKSLRHAVWGNDTSYENFETLIDREIFDGNMLSDLDNNIQIINGRCYSFSEKKGYWEILNSGEEKPKITSTFLVDARGKSAIKKSNILLKGPKTITLVRQYQCVENKTWSQVESSNIGWAWAASDGKTVYFQITIDPEVTPIKKDNLEDFFTDISKNFKIYKKLSESKLLKKRITARDSTSIINGNAVSLNHINIGDSAMAVDPLSGSGIFQSLSSTLAAIPVINSILKEKNPEIALDFYNKKILEIFLRFSRIGRDFYKDYNSDSDFYRERSSWPDTIPYDHKFDTGWNISLSPAISNGIIEQVPSIISNHSHLGISYYNNKLLAPIFNQLLAVFPDKVINIEIYNHLDSLNITENQVMPLLHWVVKNGYFKVDGISPSTPQKI
ncbi:MAG: FAD-dependent monooxygenase [Neptuniibacter sp.]